jgi:hypothetical protein
MLLDKRICGACVSDGYLKSKIAESLTVDQACDYCESVCPTIDIWSLAEHCDSVIESFYEVSSLTDAVIIYERDPEGEELSEILDRLICPPQQAIDDLVELLTEIWFDRSSLEHRYGEDPWFVEKSNLSEPLSVAWNKMEQSLRHEARYINPTAFSMLESIFGTVLDDRTREKYPVIVELGPDCHIDTLYRARVFQSLAAMEIALSHPERNIGPPPSGVGAAGRMNAKGVSVFYGSTEKETSISEVRPPVGSHVVVGAFKLTRKLRLLDLHRLGSITLKSTSSLFDPATTIEASRRDFLETLTQKMVMPVMPELEEQEYLITQAIADFLSTHPQLKLDGILFPSAQNTMASHDISKRNVILFNKASKVLNAEAHFGGASVQLWEYDEDFPSGRFEPEIVAKAVKNDEADDAHLWFDRDPINPALELDRNSIEIYEIKGVEYKHFGHKVKHTIQPEKIKAEKVC